MQPRPMSQDEIERMEIARGLAGMSETARKEGKWFFCTYQALWFSPDDLAEENKRGRFFWGPSNWTLRDPMERVSELERDVERAKVRLAEFKKRIGSTS